MKKSLFQKQYKKVLLLFFSLIIMFTGCTSLQMSPEELAKQEERLNKLQKEIETGWELLNKNDFQTAMDHFRDLNNQEHFLSAINRGIGVSRFALQDNAEVFESFLSSIKNDPLSPYSVAIAYFISSYTIYDHNEYQEYISILEEVVSSKKTPQWLKNEYNYILFDYYHTKNIDSKKYASIKNDLNILSDWQILGPFSNISQSGFQKDFIEISKQPDSGFNDNLQGKNNWTLSSYTPELENQDIFTPLSKYFSYIDYASIYAFKELEIEEDNVYEFVFSRKGSIEVWLDGEKVIEDRNYTDGNNAFYIKRELEKGSHKIYIKCGNQKKGSTFNASFYPVGGKEYKKSDLYNSLFPDELVYDPLIDGLCRKTEVNNLMESYFWLSFVLIEKGWNDQARAILDKISGMNSDSYLYQWLRAIFSKSINNYNEYEQQMLKLGEQEEIFAPARKYTLSNYIGNKRIGVAKSYLEKIKDYTPNWYYALESEMIIHLIENDNDEAFDVFTKMTSLFPDTPDTYLTMLIYGNKITENQRSRYIEKLYTNGEYKTALYYDYRFAKLGENYEYATSKLLEYLTHYPINENLWNQYIDLLYEDDSFTFLDLRETTKEIGETFPISYDLLMNEKWQSSTLFHEMESYYNENKSLFSSKTPQVNKFLSDMEKEKTAYKQALEKIVLLYPYNLETRDELRELNNMKQFGKELKITDSYFLIDQFEESSFKYDNNDAVIVYNDRKEIFFGDGASTILQHTILKILTLTGVEDNRYQYLEFHPAFGDGVLDEAFILKENGMKIYADRSGRKLAFRGLNPGDYIVIRYSVDSYIPGEINNEIWASSTLQSIYPIFQKDFHLIYPDSYDLDFNYNNISEKDVNQKTDQFIEGYNQKQISVKTTQPLVIKSLSPHWRDTYPWIDASSIKSWDNIIGWYDTLYLGQIEASLPVEKKAMELCEGLDDPNEKIRQLFNYVSNKIEYEDLSFQYSNFIPQTSDSIFRDGYGDCKDQSVLLISMLKAVGIDSYIALNSPGYTGDSPYLPSPRFTHAIVAIPGQEGVTYLDPTTTYSTYRELPASMINSYVLHITDDGKFERINSNVELQKTYYLLEIQGIGHKGTINGSIVYQGNKAGRIRYLYKGLDKKEQDVRFTEMTNSWIPGFSLEELEIENSNDLFYDPKITFSGNIPSLLTKVEDKIYKLNCPWTDMLDSSVNFWLGVNSDEYGMRISDSNLSTPTSQTIIIDIPSDYSLYHLPDTSHLRFDDSYIKYSYEYRNDKIICTREYYISNQIIPPDRIGKFKEFIQDAISLKQEDLYLKSL